MFANPFTPNSRSAVVHHSETSGGVEYAVYQQAATRWIGTGDGAVQAAIQLDEPDAPALRYVRTMLSGLTLTPSPARVLELGYGAGTMRRALQRATPGARIVSVECNHTVVDIGHRWLGGVAKHRVVMARAERFLRQPQAAFDAVFCDLHTPPGDASPIVDAGFHAMVYARLDEDGVYVLNLLPRDREDALALVQCVRAHFDHIWLQAVPDSANVVLHARKQPLVRLNPDAPYAAAWRQLSSS